MSTSLFLWSLAGLGLLVGIPLYLQMHKDYQNAMKEMQADWVKICEKYAASRVRTNPISN